MQDDIRQRLLAEMRRRGWSVQRLLDESGLDCDRASLHRKLVGWRKGKSENRRARVLFQPMTEHEIAALARALDLRLVDARLEAA